MGIKQVLAGLESKQGLLEKVNQTDVIKKGVDKHEAGPMKLKKQKLRKDNVGNQRTVTEIRATIDTCTSLIEFLKNNFAFNQNKSNPQPTSDKSYWDKPIMKNNKTNLDKMMKMDDFLSQSNYGDTKLDRSKSTGWKVRPNCRLERKCCMCEFGLPKSSKLRLEREGNVRLPLVTLQNIKPSSNTDPTSTNSVNKQKSHKKCERTPRSQRDITKETSGQFCEINSVHNPKQKTLTKRKIHNMATKSIASLDNSLAHDLDSSLKKLDRIVEDFKENVTSVISKKKSSVQARKKCNSIQSGKTNRAKRNFTLKSYVPIYGQSNETDSEQVVAVQMGSEQDYKRFIDDLVQSENVQTTSKPSKKKQCQKKPNPNEDNPKEDSQKVKVRKKKLLKQTISTNSINKSQATDVSTELSVDSPVGTSNESPNKQSKIKKKFQSKSEEKIQNIEMSNMGKLPEMEKIGDKNDPALLDKLHIPKVKPSRSQGIIMKLEKNDDVQEKRRKPRSNEGKLKRKNKLAVNQPGDGKRSDYIRVDGKRVDGKRNDDNRVDDTLEIHPLPNKILSNDIIKSTKYDVTIEKFVEYARSQLNSIDNKHLRTRRMDIVSMTSIPPKKTSDKSSQTEFEVFVVDFPSSRTMDDFIDVSPRKNETEDFLKTLKSKNERYVLAVQQGMDLARKSITEFFQLVQRMDSQFSNHVLTKLTLKKNDYVKMLAEENKDTCALTYLDGDEKALQKTQADLYQYENLRNKKVDTILLKNFSKVEHYLNMVMYYYKMIVNTKNSLDKVIEKRFFEPYRETKAKLSVNSDTCNATDSLNNGTLIIEEITINTSESRISREYLDEYEDEMEKLNIKIDSVPKKKGLDLSVGRNSKKASKKPLVENNARLLINIIDPNIPRSKTNSSEETFTSTKTKFLFDEDEDYHEEYLDPLINEVTLEPYAKPCESTPSLPAVQVDTNRCDEDRLEIPWLQITLPPPGTLQIKDKRVIKKKKAPCSCWRSREDVTEVEPPEKTTQAPDGICKCLGTEETVGGQAGKTIPTDSSTNAEKNEDADRIEEPSAEEPIDNTPDYLESDLPDDHAKESVAEENVAEETIAEAAVAEEAVAEEPVTEEPIAGEPVVEEPVAEEPVAEEPVTEGPSDEPENELPPPPPIQVATKIEERNRNEAQGVQRKECTCVDDPCKDFKQLMMVYDDPCYSGHESYMDGLYQLFPDDCDQPCGPYTEIPWDDIVIPRNIKLRGVSRTRKDTTTIMQECWEFFGPDPNDPNTRALIRADRNEMIKRDNIDIELNIEEFMKELGLPPCSCISMKFNTNDNVGKQTCTCFEMGQKKPEATTKTCPSRSNKDTMSDSKRKSDKRRSRRREIMDALDSCQAEMLPIREALTELKAKVKALRQNRYREVKPTKDISCGCNAFLPHPFRPPTPKDISCSCKNFPAMTDISCSCNMFAAQPFSITMPMPVPIPTPPPAASPFLATTTPPPTSPFMPPTLPPRGIFSPISSPAPPPGLRPSPKICPKCKRRKPTKKDPNSSGSDHLSKRRGGQTQKDRAKHKKCRCPKKFAEKMTNTRRKEGKCAEIDKTLPSIVPTNLMNNTLLQEEKCGQTDKTLPSIVQTTQLNNTRWQEGKCGKIHTALPSIAPTFPMNNTRCEQGKCGKIDKTLPPIVVTSPMTNTQRQESNLDDTLPYTEPRNPMAASTPMQRRRDYTGGSEGELIIEECS